MSDQDPFSAIAAPIGESIAQHLALPPYQKNVARASLGAGLLAWCAYTAATFGPYAQQLPPLVLGAWAGCAGLGLLWLGVGARNARGPRDVMAAFWSAVIAVGCIWLLWVEAYPSDWGPWVPFLLKGCYLAVLASRGVRFWIVTRGMPGDAQKMVKQEIEQKKVAWRSARRR